MRALFAKPAGRAPAGRGGAADRDRRHGAAAPNPALLATGDYRPQDREMALDIDRLALAIKIETVGGLLVAEPHWHDRTPGPSGSQ